LLRLCRACGREAIRIDGGPLLMHPSTGRRVNLPWHEACVRLAALSRIKLTHQLGKAQIGLAHAATLPPDIPKRL